MKRLLTIGLLALAPLPAFAATYSFENNSSLDSLAHGTAYTWGLGGTTYTNLLNELKAPGNMLTGATLKIYDIRDWRIEPKDVLYVNILNGLDVGTDSHTYNTQPSNYDTQWGKNAFEASSGNFNTRAHQGLNFNNAQAGSLLKAPGVAGDVPGTWTDPYQGIFGLDIGHPLYDLTIEFSAANLALLETFLLNDINRNNPAVGLGFAAECHYYLDKVKLEITVGPQPQQPPPTGVPDTAATLALIGLSLIGLSSVRRFLK